MVKAGCLVLYRSLFDTVRDLLHDEAFKGHDKIMAKYLKPDLLILDDVPAKTDPQFPSPRSIKPLEINRRNDHNQQLKFRSPVGYNPIRGGWL